MQNGVHFISGLPRSGSSLLAGLLRQNPKFHADVTSPVGRLILAALKEMSAGHEGSSVFDDDRRTIVLRALFEAFYHDIHREKLIFDTNRIWCAKAPTLRALYPRSKIV